MDDQRLEILDLLDYISNQKRTLDLITNFRGIPIHLTSSVIRCSQTTGTVRVHVHHRQIISIKAADHILVQSDIFPNPLIGHIDQIDLDSAVITLRDLRYVTGSMGNRKKMRVQPESPTNVELIMGHGYSLLGEMIDISLEGLSINLSKDQYPQDDIFILETPVEIHLGLPVNLPASDKIIIHDISVQAIIAYTKESQQTYRIGLLTFLKEPDLGILRRYIFDRQTEILNEIQHMNNTLLESA